MNYYKHHLGDYDSATAHLTWLEDMAYTRLIRLYYRREGPLPADTAQVCRLIRAVDSGQIEAVQTVLQEFFELGDDGWHNRRCDEEIVGYHAQAERSRINGRSGGRPPSRLAPKETNPAGIRVEPNGFPLGTNREPSSNLNQNQNQNQNHENISPPSCDNVAVSCAPPISGVRTSSRNKGVVRSKTAKSEWMSVLVAEGVDEQVALDWLAVRRAKGKPMTETVLAGIKREAQAAGLPVSAAVKMAAEKSWLGFKAEWVKGESATLPAMAGKDYSTGVTDGRLI